MNSTVIWAALVIIFLVTEALTYQMLTTWFAVGAAVSAVLSAMGIGSLWQIVAFFAVSAVCFALLRPVALKLLKKSTFKSNVDALIGETVLVTEDIDNVQGKGLGNLGGMQWSIRSENGECIRSGEQAYVKKIEGVKLVVSSTKGD